MKRFVFALLAVAVVLASAGALWAADMEADREAEDDGVLIPEDIKTHCLMMREAGMCGCLVDSCACLDKKAKCRGSGSSDKLCEPE